MTSAKTPPANNGDLGHNAVGYCVHHFRASANDPAPFRILADHEAVHIMQKHKRDAVLVTVQNEARGLLRRLGIDHTTKLDAFLVGAARESLHVLFLVRNDSDRPATDASIAAKQRLAILGAVFLEFTRIHKTRNDFSHVVLLGGIAREYPIDFLSRAKRLPCLYVAERRHVRRAHFVRKRSNPRDT